MRRTDAVDMWRAGYDAGARAASREAGANIDRAASYLAACRARDTQTAFDGLLLELVAAVASMFCPVCAEELPADSGRCDACTARARRSQAVAGSGAAAWPGERREAA